MVAAPKKQIISWQSKIMAENKTQQMQISAESFCEAFSNKKSESKKQQIPQIEFKKGIRVIVKRKNDWFIRKDR